MIKSTFKGLALHIQRENAFRTQEATLVRPAQIKLRVSKTLVDINRQLAADPELAAVYNSLTITIPE